MANSSTMTDVRTTMQLAYEQMIAAMELPAYVWIGMVLLAAVALCYSLNVHTNSQLRIAQQEYNQVANEVRQLEVENMRLARDLEAVEKDPRTIETLARQVGMVANNETVLLIRNTTPAIQN